MKKQIAIAALSFGAIVLGTNNVHAQTTSSATTTVNIQLADVISLTAGSGTQTVGFNYATAADYNTEQTVNMPSALIITSTKPFKIDVKAEGPNFLNGVNVIPVNVLTIKAAAAAGTMGGTKTAVVLSDAIKPLVANAPLGSALTLNLDYTIPASESSSAKILGKPAGKYTQTVTYTATAL